MKHMIAAAAALLLTGFAVAQPKADQNQSAVKVGTVAPSARPASAVVDAFHAALRRGDAKAALSYLADDALVYESGGVERSREEYASHHLGADAAFAKTVHATVIRRAGEAADAVAWIATESRTTGSYKDKAIDRVTTETMVLRRVGGVWKIAHIHWSSAPVAE